MPDSLFSSAAETAIDHHLAPLETWLKNSRVHDIAINQPAPKGPSEAWICQAGEWSRHQVDMDLDDLVSLALAAGSYRRQEIRDGAPILSTDMPGRWGVYRGEFILWNFIVGGACMTLRRRESRVAPMSEFAARYEIDPGQAKAVRTEEMLQLYNAGKENIEARGAFFSAATKGRLNSLIVGPTDAGKSTLTETIMTEIDPTERLFIMEDALELIVTHENVLRFIWSSGNLAGSDLSLESLIKAALRHHPDRIMLPEVRDADAAWVLIMILSMGHPGIVSTLHCRTPGEAVRRLLTLGRTSKWGQGADHESLLNLIEPAIDVIAPMRRDGAKFYIGDIWYREAERLDGKSIADLVKEP